MISYLNKMIILLLQNDSRQSRVLEVSFFGLNDTQDDLVEVIFNYYTYIIIAKL